MQPRRANTRHTAVTQTGSGPLNSRESETSQDAAKVVSAWHKQCSTPTFQGETRHSARCAIGCVHFATGRILSGPAAAGEREDRALRPDPLVWSPAAASSLRLVRGGERGNAAVELQR